MTKERIEIVRQSLIPFVQKELLKIDYEGLGKSDAEEFKKDLNEILDLAIHALEQQPSEDCVSRQAVNELFDNEIKMYEERIETRKGSNYHDETKTIKEFRSRIANAEYWQEKIKALPPITPTQRWIPVTNPYKDLPKSNRLWVTRKETTLGRSYYGVDIIGYDMTEWDDDISSVIAYMEFTEPKPYEEKRGSEND